MKRLLVAAMLAAASFEIAANAMTFSFVNPANGCTYSVTGPDFTVQCIAWCGITKSGGVSESVSCP